MGISIAPRRTGCHETIARGANSLGRRLQRQIARRSRRTRCPIATPSRRGMTKFRAVLFDAAETLFTTRGSVGEIYGSLAQQYGSKAPTDAIQAAFARQFRGAGPLSTQDQKRWWKDVVYRVFSEVGMVNNFDRFFDQVYDRFRDSGGWVLYPETTEVLAELKQRGLKLGVISNFDDRAYSV